MCSASSLGPLAKIWLAAHMEKKVTKVQVMQTNIKDTVGNIANPQLPMALRVSGHLLLGKVQYLLTDSQDALVKIKDAFKQNPGSVELTAGAGTKSYNHAARHL